jgi:hypothetical protein
MSAEWGQGGAVASCNTSPTAPLRPCLYLQARTRLHALLRAPPASRQVHRT